MDSSSDRFVRDVELAYRSTNKVHNSTLLCNFSQASGKSRPRDFVS